MYRHLIRVLWIGVFLIPIRIRISIMIPIRFQIGIKTMPIHMWIPSYPKFQVLHMLENLNFVLLLVTTLPVYNALSFSSVSNESYF